MLNRSLAAALFALPLLASSACGGVVAPSENRIEEFSGAVDPLGEGPEHDFSVSRNGEFEIRFLTLDPGNAILQIVFGRFIGDTCLEPLGQSLGGQNSIVLAGAISPGRYCVLAFDDGLITQRVTYTVRVSYP